MSHPMHTCSRVMSIISLLAFAFIPAMLGQDYRAKVQGTVTDSSSAGGKP